MGYLSDGTVTNCLLYNVRVVYPHNQSPNLGIIAGYQANSAISNTHYRDCLISSYGSEGSQFSFRKWFDYRYDDQGRTG